MSINLTEITRELVQKQIKDNIKDALALVRNDRADAYVTTEPPNSYFMYAPAQAYRCPAVFTITDRVQFRVAEKNGNSLTAIVKMRVAVIVEDRDMDHLTVKADRYMAAIHQCINEKTVLAPDSQVKIFIRVESAEFGDIFSPGRDEARGVFRKDLLFNCDVEHFEAL